MKAMKNCYYNVWVHKPDSFKGYACKIFSHFCLTAKLSERIIDGLKFSLVFIRSLLDDITMGLNSFCKDNLDISKVLRLERALLSQQQNKVHD